MRERRAYHPPGRDIARILDGVASQTPPVTDVPSAKPCFPDSAPHYTGDKRRERGSGASLKQSPPGTAGYAKFLWLLSASGVMEACGGAFRYDDGFSRSLGRLEHGVLPS